MTTVTASFAFFFERGRAAVPTVFMVAGDEITVTSHVRRGEARRSEGPLSLSLSLSLGSERCSEIDVGATASCHRLSNNCNETTKRKNHLVDGRAEAAPPPKEEEEEEEEEEEWTTTDSPKDKGRPQSDGLTGKDRT